MQQRTPEWLAARLTGIGGSEAAALYDASPWISQYGLWARKTGRLKEDADLDPQDRPDLYWGSVLEGEIKKAYARISGRSVGDGLTMKRCTTCDRLFANTDGSVSSDDLGWGVLETKVVNWFSAKEWAHGVPVYVRIQVQQYMLCSGFSWASVAPYFSGRGQPIEWFDEEYDQRFCEDLCERADRWWDYHVRRDIPPDPDGSKDSESTLRKIWTDSVGYVHLPSSMLQVVDDLIRARATYNEVKRERALLESKIRASMGDAAKGSLPDGRVIEMPVVHRSSYVAPETSYRPIKIVDRNANA